MSFVPKTELSGFSSLLLKLLFKKPQSLESVIRLKLGLCSLLHSIVEKPLQPALSPPMFLLFSQRQALATPWAGVGDKGRWWGPGCGLQTAVSSQSVTSLPQKRTETESKSLGTFKINFQGNLISIKSNSEIRAYI